LRVLFPRDMVPASSCCGIGELGSPCQAAPMWTPACVVAFLNS
jgi:hypothetical protein